mmetsp:Transcript_16844/g.39515  ORF Transcript_16844/g.39515 Transcript_16844/m.39515 type:complete len:394 (-) Transcript_16844:58-1239(-)|eukprot:CAMPEP_0171095076 /NCGR_PEP_ID=MMETSP0766_2-20121228/42972_1 /TAXON_ID=439317 /ORGANISM="Gambierdiscus australes, Strain CAWD 149" /LENGTH=393 /DNA_ID=CAMNT_0011553847 /DNA_START=28 /DNA_END=1209 /DNA_ORIENTATION=+
MSTPVSSPQQRWRKLRGLHAAVRLRRSVQPIVTFTLSDCCLNSAPLADLDAAPARERNLSCLARRASTCTSPAAVLPEKKFWPVAIVSTALGVLCVVPYNAVLLGDPSSPLLVSFALHVAIVARYLPRARTLLLKRRIPFSYHAAMVTFGCCFTLFKADAFMRLPASVCMLLSNTQMVMGVLVQFFIFRKRYNSSQISGVVLVTVGIAWAGQAMQTHRGSRGDEADGQAAGDFLLGVVEILASSLSLVLLGHTVKVSFARFGENVDEQVLMQHLLAILIIFPSQWEKIGPRLAQWASNRDAWLVFNLVVCVLLNVAARSASIQMSGRAPNLLMTQLVNTLEQFLQLLSLAFLRVPPWPPGGFWTGTLVLLLGTLQYLRASAVSSEGDEKLGSP